MFAVAALVLGTGGGIRFLAWVTRYDLQSDAVHGDPLTQSLWVGVYAASIFLLAWRGARLISHIGASSYVWPTVLWAALSVAWSDAPEMSIKRVGALIGSTFVGAYLGARYTPRDLFRLTLWATGFCALASLAITLSDPSRGTMTGTLSAGYWQGIFPHKNWLGRFMALAAVLWLLRLREPTGRRPVSFGFMVLSIALLVLSYSASSVVVLSVLLMLLPLVWTWSTRFTLAIPMTLLGLLLAGAIAMYVTSNTEGVLDALGKDRTLTGRLPLWSLVWKYIWLRPLLGYGYGGFWLGMEGPSAGLWIESWDQGRGWLPPDSHNGLLDLCLDLGAIGVALFLIPFLGNMRRSFELARRDASAQGVFPFLFLVLLVMSNITTSALVTHNSIFWILYVAVSLQLAIGAASSANTD